MLVVLERLFETQAETFGLLRAGALQLWTVELPWRANSPGVSRVPAGGYALVPHSSPRHPATFALVGRSVSHQPEPGVPRAAVLFHAANCASELRGCIAPGMELGFFGERLGVRRSREAMDLLRATLRAEPGPHELRIAPIPPATDERVTLGPMPV